VFLFKTNQPETFVYSFPVLTFELKGISFPVKYIADLHIHSHYSRATSKDLNLESLYQWARIKGIQVVGTGDFTHPGWIKELEEKLEPCGNGLFRLKNPPKGQGLPNVKTKDADVFFCLSTEISSIYKYGEKVRKNHNTVFVPDIETAKKFNARLSEIGNLASDGRPILGLPSRDLLEIVLGTSENAHLIPAHVWTPWFSTLGSQGGYDSIEACFRDLSAYIFALETGLSSDPPMNWKLSALDRYSLVSNSDAHSPQKLGREANIFETELSYFAMFEALKTRKGFSGTYEFFPEEGKYHLDGHRKCNVVLEPRESLKRNNLCPACGKPLTIGVLHRVEKLADREDPQKPAGAPGFEYIIPLPEIIAEFIGAAPASKAVQQALTQIISTFGNEFELLHTVPLDEIRSRSGELLAEAIRRLREHEVYTQAGYDGEYGVITVFNPEEITRLIGQTDIFGGSMIERMIRRTVKNYVVERQPHPDEVQTAGPKLNEEQRLAVRHEGNVLVTAGPGTGKTNTLIHWIVYQIEERGIAPHEVMAITFTNKAAEELRERLQKQIGVKAAGVLVGTFHAVAYRFLNELIPETWTIYDKNNRISLFKILFSGKDQATINEFSHEYEQCYEKNRMHCGDEYRLCFETYHKYLAENHGVDISSLITQTKQLLLTASCNITDRYKCIAVDEFQDINPAQYEFIRLISENKQLFAIGDPNQSIYGFRGSDINLFYRAKDDLKTTGFFLKKNYRNPQCILDASNELISNNQQRAAARLEATKTSNILIKQFTAENSKEEAAYIADQVLNYVGGVDSLSTGRTRSDYNYAFSDIAVLYRTHSIADEISRQLIIKGIPLLLSDGTSFFSEPPFDVIANALQLLQNKKNMVALSGLTERLLELDAGKKLALLKKIVENEIDLDDFQQHEKWGKWVTLYKRLCLEWNKKAIQYIVEQLLDFFVPEQTLTEQQQVKKEMIIKLAGEFNENPGDFLQKYILSPYTDASRLKSGGVRLMTFHAAKGLEFPVVFIAGADEGITPLGRNDTDLEEERRLFYVAMSRARDELQIVRSRKRKQYGSEKDMAPSRFLNEFDPQYSRQVEFNITKKEQARAQQLKLF
jgi:uncharacterized protein (TIGR00375 family)